MPGVPFVAKPFHVENLLAELNEALWGGDSQGDGSGPRPSPALRRLLPPST